MEFNCTYGEICDPRGTLSVEWKLPDYFSMPQRADSCMESPTFQFSNSNWLLKIFPNGERADNSVDNIILSIYLDWEHPLESHLLIINMGIKHFDGKVKDIGPFRCVFNPNIESHSFVLMKRTELLRLRRQYVPHGILTIYCIGKLSSVLIDASSQTILQDNTIDLSRDFENLFLSGEKADVTLQVSGHAFRAHKLVLETRSSVFAAMFQHNMKESNNGMVNISDCDPNVFHTFLLFLYTGKLENLSPDNMVKLFIIADKYNLKELREKCVRFMKRNLSVHTVCDVIAVADRHYETELRDSAKELLVRNIKTILPTENWKSFYRENPVLAVELLMTVI